MRGRVTVVVAVMVIAIVVVIIIVAIQIVTVKIVASGAAKMICCLIIVYLNSSRFSDKLTRTIIVMIRMTFEVTSASVFPIVSVSPRLLIRVAIFKSWISAHPSAVTAWRRRRFSMIHETGRFGVVSDGRAGRVRTPAIGMSLQTRFLLENGFVVIVIRRLGHQRVDGGSGG